MLSAMPERLADPGPASAINLHVAIEMIPSKSNARMPGSRIARTLLAIMLPFTFESSSSLRMWCHAVLWVMGMRWVARRLQGRRTS
jgi:hypothetical protein